MKVSELKRMLTVLQRIQALGSDPNSPPKTIEQLAQEVAAAVEVFAMEVEPVEYDWGSPYAPTVWCCIQIEGDMFSVGWGIEEAGGDPFNQKPTIREALYEALRVMAACHKKESDE